MLECVGACPTPPQWLVSGVIGTVVVAMFAFAGLTFRGEADAE